MALTERLQLPAEVPFEYLDLVATAIAADIVPVTGENRILAYFGLQRLNSEPCAGLRALMEISGLRRELDVDSVVFSLGPRINAAGRIAHAHGAVELLVCGCSLLSVTSILAICTITLFKIKL